MDAFARIAQPWIDSAARIGADPQDNDETRLPVVAGILLREEFELEPRGAVPIKGKGDVETWYLVGGPSA